MKKHIKLSQVGLAVAATLISSSAFATNGYMPHGLGMKAKGMGGAGVALADDAFAGANNPAAAGFSGNRFELGLDFFSPKRKATNSNFGDAGSSEDSLFFIPELGYNRTLSEKTSVGIAVYGNGGMNTSFKTNILGGTGKMGVNLEQLTIAPTFAYKPSSSLSLGVSPLFVYQRFEAYGLQGFSGLTPSSSTAYLTNVGNDSSTGFGLRIGFLSKISDALSIGASFSPKINMSSFTKYKELFAEGGDFDIPAISTVGLAASLSPTTLLALDVSRINYGGVKSINNPQSYYANGLGGTNGGGFGWQSITVVKVGVEHKLSDTTTIRAGFNHGQNPIGSADTTFNILAPGVVKNHFTAGASYDTSKSDRWTWAFMYAPNVSVSGPRPGGFGGGTDTIQMKEYSFGIQYGYKF